MGEEVSRRLVGQVGALARRRAVCVAMAWTGRIVVAAWVVVYFASLLVAHVVHGIPSRGLGHVEDLLLAPSGPPYYLGEGYVLAGVLGLVCVLGARRMKGIAGGSGAPE